MTKKLWFQLGIGILLSLIIIKFLVDVQWIFSPLIIIGKTIFLPILIAGVLFYISKPLQTILEKFLVGEPLQDSIIIGILFTIFFEFYKVMFSTLFGIFNKN